MEPWGIPGMPGKLHYHLGLNEITPPWCRQLPHQGGVIRERGFTGQNVLRGPHCGKWGLAAEAALRSRGILQKRTLTYPRSSSLRFLFSTLKSNAPTMAPDNTAAR